MTPKINEIPVAKENKENILSSTAKPEIPSNIQRTAKQKNGIDEVSSTKVIARPEAASKPRTIENVNQNSKNSPNVSSFLEQKVLPSKPPEQPPSNKPIAVETKGAALKGCKEKCEISKDRGNKERTPFESYIAKDEKKDPPTSLNISAELDEFNDSFVLDTQLVNLMTESASGCKPTGKTPTKPENKTTNADTPLSSKAPTNGSSPRLKANIPKQDPVKTDQFAESKSRLTSPVSANQRVAGETKKPRSSADMTLQLDLSNDDDLENFMDQYCTQMDLDNRSPVAPAQAVTPPKANPHLGSDKRAVISTGPVAKTETHSADVSNGGVDVINTSGQDDLWSDTEMLYEQDLGSSFTESPHELLNTSSFISAQNRVPSSNLAIMPPPDPFSPPNHRRHSSVGRPIATSSRDVSHTEELAYMSLHSDSSALLELEDVAVPDEAADKEKEQAHMDLSQYFEDNFGSYGAALDDSWTFSLHRSHIDSENRKGDRQTNDPSEKHLNVGIVENGGSRENGKATDFPGRFPPTNIAREENATKAQSSFEPSSRCSSKGQTSKRPTEKRKSEENTPECTPSKVRKTSDMDNSSDKNESNTSDCVPPTPPELKASTTPKTQVRKTGKKAKKPSKTSQRKSQRVKEPTCAAQLNYTETAKRATRSSQRAAHSESNVSKSNKRGLSALLPEDSPEKPDPSPPRVEGRPDPTSPAPVSQGIPLTNERFTIIDVTSNKMLFDHFVMEWKTRRWYSLCLACEKLDHQAAPTSTIGANFMNKR